MYTVQIYRYVYNHIYIYSKGIHTHFVIAYSKGIFLNPMVIGTTKLWILSTSHLRKVGLLGAGGFGAVELWEHKATHETYVAWHFFEGSLEGVWSYLF